MAKLVSPKTIEYLHNRWTLFCQKIGAKDSDIVWEWIKAAYTEPSRYYHNLNHIYQCLQVLDSAITNEENDNWDVARLPEVEFAIWFHDIVYKTIDATDNEAESLEIAFNALGVLGLPNGYQPSLRTMIMATKHDFREVKYYELMLDIDLSILGQSLEIYQQYEEQIRLEYGWVPLVAYCDARINILEKILNAPNIYRTEMMKKRFEAQARENVKNAINALEDKKELAFSKNG